MCTDGAEKYKEALQSAMTNCVAGAMAFLGPVEVSYETHPWAMVFTLRAPGKWTASLALYGGLPDVAVSTQFLIEPPHRDNGWAQYLDGVKVRAAQALNCSTLLATVRADNAAELASIFKRGWKMVDYVPIEGLGEKVPHLMFTKKVR